MKSCSLFAAQWVQMEKQIPLPTSYQVNPNTPCSHTSSSTGWLILFSPLFFFLFFFSLSSHSAPVEGQGDNGVKVYHLHSPFTPPETSNTLTPGKPHTWCFLPSFASSSHPLHHSLCFSFLPSVYTSGGGNLGSGLDSGDNKRKFVSYDTALGSSPGMTTCASCQQQVMTNVTYKAGTYAWLMCLLFICCGWVCGSGCLS